MDENYILEENEGSFFQYLLNIIKRHIVLILVVTILFAGGGVAYGYLQKPVYTASNKVAFQARTTNDSSSVTSYDINVMRSYIDTVVDFCDEGVVTDRANYYYVRWLNEKRTNNYEKVEEFIAVNELNDQYNGNDPNHTNLPQKYFDKAKISTSTKTVLNETQLIFSVKYKGEDKAEVTDKVKILTYALAKEIGSRPDPNNPNKILVSEYFTDLYVEIKDLGFEGASTSTSKAKTLIMFTAIGAFAGLAIACVINKLDITVKSKEELEAITGVKLLSSVENQGGNRNGK